MSRNCICFSLLFWGLHQFSSAIPELNFSVLEENPVNTYVGNIATVSFNSGDYWFKFKKQNQYTDLFHINITSGIITTAKPIDREQICDSDSDEHTCVLNVNVDVQSKTDTQFLKSVQVKISIDDINDNAPLFDKDEVSLNILESDSVGREYSIEDAHDLDTGVNNSIKLYELSNDQDKFSLIKKDGLLGGLKLINNLDHEEQDFYQLVIVAKDGGTPQRSGSVVVNVTVLDVNDNAPKFQKKAYNVSILENWPLSSIVLTLHAEDNDSGSNGQIGYKFKPRTSTRIKKMFKVNEKSGEIVLIGRVDYEDKPKYSFNVIAFDYGTTSHSSTASVNVHVVDINDNKPDINIFLHSVNMSESASIGKFITYVSINDKDYDQNGNVSCSVNDDHFSLQINNGESYKVVISKPLDFEKAHVHNVSIRCHDYGTPQLRSEKSFLVLVSDENDNPPIFEQTLIKASITENNKVHDYVTNVTARDNDTGINSEIHYELHHNVQLWFNINNQTGIITANKQFDREQNAEIKFQVLAIDSGSPALTGTATVLLNILDINDETPHFKKSYYKFHAEENLKPDTFIGKVEAQDLDHRENGRIEYSILKNNTASELFKVTDGVLKTKVSLNGMKGQIYDFLVSAADHGKKPMSSSTNVTVIVDDVNDNYPYIIYPTDTNNTISVIYEMTPIDKPISRVIAHDDDEGNNAMLSYFLKDTTEPAGLFRINRTSGEIMLNKNLDMEVQNKSYELLITVKDHGKPSKSTSTTLIVLLNGGNVRKNGGKDKNHENKGMDPNQELAVILSSSIVLMMLAIVAILCIVDKVAKSRRQYPARKYEDASLQRKKNTSIRNEKLNGKGGNSLSLDRSISIGCDNPSSPTVRITPKNADAPSLQYSNLLLRVDSLNFDNCQEQGHQLDQNSVKGSCAALL